MRFPIQVYFLAVFLVLSVNGADNSAKSCAKPYNKMMVCNTWKTLIGSQASLQTVCNKKGFNAVGSNKRNSKARIGILGNDQKDCSSSDSRIGFGTGGHHDDSNTCGNYVLKGATSDNGAKNIKAMGYILVQ